jgi:hypothetical protein
MKKLLHLQVTVEHGRPLAGVCERLEAIGFRVGETLAEIDVIVGTAPASALARLRRVPGVTDVAEQSPIDLGPPPGEGGSAW